MTVPVETHVGIVSSGDSASSGYVAVPGTFWLSQGGLLLNTLQCQDSWWQELSGPDARSVELRNPVL